LKGLKKIFLNFFVWNSKKIFKKIKFKFLIPGINWQAPTFFEKSRSHITFQIRVPNRGPKSGSQIGVPNQGPKSGCQIRVPFHPPNHHRITPQIRVLNWGPPKKKIRVSNWGFQIGVPNQGPKLGSQIFYCWKNHETKNLRESPTPTRPL
jgi:hypothetical protein